MENDISVVVTIFNDQNILSRFISDIENQSMKPREVVIADGGSKDNSKEILERWKNESEIQIKLFFGERLNISEGFNKAIKEAGCDTIVVMAVGNTYPSNFIEELYNEIKTNEYDAVYTPIRGNDLNSFSGAYNKTVLGGECVMNMPSNHGVMIKKSVVEELGYYYEHFAYAGEDFEFFVRFNNFKKKSKCVRTTYLTWDTPTSFKEYKKQIYVYLVGLLQAATNWYVFRYKIKEIAYIAAILFSVLLLVFRLTRIIGIIILLLILLLNIIWLVKNSVKGWAIKNLQIFMDFIYLFKANKYLLGKNKISEDRRLR